MRGLKAGFPIGLGYLSVSFSFGIMAVSAGFAWWQALIISMLCVTSAGQFAGIGIMVNPGQYLEMVLSQLTINIRYSFMSISLSQKADSSFGRIFKWIFGFMITDEIFAVAVTEDKLSRTYMAGLVSMPYAGWSLGTLLGALSGSVLPDSIMSALCIALYGMFVAIIAPVVIENRPTLIVVAIAIAMSCIFYYVPFFSRITYGLSITVCAIVAAALGAIMFPVENDEDMDTSGCVEEYEDEDCKEAQNG